jgi:hypothetical protein
MGKGYMGDSKIHAGGGSEAVWGGGPSWFKDSVDAGRGQRGDFSLEQFRKEQADKAAAAKTASASPTTPSAAAPGFGDGFGNDPANPAGATPSTPSAAAPATGTAADEVNASRARLASPPPVGGDPMSAVTPSAASTQEAAQSPSYDAMGNVTGVQQPDTVGQEVDKAKAADTPSGGDVPVQTAPSSLPGGGGTGGGGSGDGGSQFAGGNDEFSPLLAVMASTMFGQGAA